MACEGRSVLSDMHVFFLPCYQFSVRALRGKKTQGAVFDELTSARRYTLYLVLGLRSRH
jgi:hypothetical protein